MRRAFLIAVSAAGLLFGACSEHSEPTPSTQAEAGPNRSIPSPEIPEATDDSVPTRDGDFFRPQDVDLEGEDGPHPGEPGGPCRRLDEDLEKAKALRKDGESARAVELYSDVQARAMGMGCGCKVARAYNGLAVVDTAENRLRQSLEYLNEALASLERARLDGNLSCTGTEGENLERSIEQNLSASYFRLGRFSEALESVRRTRRLHLATGATAEQQVGLSLQASRIHRWLDDPLAAQSALSRTQSRVDEADLATRAAWYQERSNVHKALGDPDAADEDLLLARRILESQLEEGESSDSLAAIDTDLAILALERGHAERALQLLDASEGHLVVDGEPTNSHDWAHARYLRSLALAGTGELDESRRYLEICLGILETLHDDWREIGLGYRAMRQDYFRHGFDLAARSSSDADSALFSAFEDYRARGLLENIVTSGTPPMEEASPAAARRSDTLGDLGRRVIEKAWALDRWSPSDGEQEGWQLRSELFELRAELFRMKAVHGQVETVGSPSSSAPLLDLRAAAELLDERTLGLAWIAGREATYVLAFDRRGRSRIAVVGSKAREATRELAEAMNADPEEEVGEDPRARKAARITELGRRLGRQLLGSLVRHGADEPGLDAFDRLAVVLDDPFGELPLPMLHHPLTDRPLVESHGIVRLPSFAVLDALRRRTADCDPPEGSVLALGDPVFGSDDDRWPGGFVSPRGPRTDLDFRSLPHTEDEVRDIGDLYGQDATVLLGFQATYEELKARIDRFRILHLATHARGDRQIPERSRLALSCVDASGTVLEICDLYLDSVTELELCGQTVVLSACSTAIGPGLAGEGILGLPRAFLEAGATAVVASLWDVDDERTAQLMTLFHQRLLEGHGTAEALGLAQSELARSGMSARTWGAFVVIGDG